MRPPTMPNGTAQTAISSTIHFGAPRRRSRTSAIAQAATMPSRMNRAYARSGSGPRYQIPWVGLGKAVTVTATTYRLRPRPQARSRSRFAHC